MTKTFLSLISVLTAAALLGPAAAFSFSPISPTKTNVIAGATGYIGKSVVHESVEQGYKTIALVRDLKKIQSLEGQARYGECFEGAEVVQCNVADPEEVQQVLKDISSHHKIESIISCLAAQSGIKKDAYAIDYQATKNCLDAGIEVNARHFVLLSAFCVAKPKLQFQYAKLKFEAALAAQDKMTWSIVRPTAFFKSVSGQLPVVQGGSPFVMFANGKTRANPISEKELSTYMVDCISVKERENKILNIGGPDGALTRKEQGEMLFKAVGLEPKYAYAPLELFDVLIKLFDVLSVVTKNERLADAAEQCRIGKYYACEDMLTTKPEEKYGRITLQDYFNQIAVEGQEAADDVNTQALMKEIFESLVPKPIRRFGARLTGRKEEREESDIANLIPMTNSTVFY